VGGEVEINTLLPPFLINAIYDFLLFFFVLTQNKRTKEKVNADCYFKSDKNVRLKIIVELRCRSKQRLEISGV
jgi:hypothetical protein